MSPDLARAAQAIAERGIALGTPLVVLEETTSTNDEAKRAAKSGAPHGATWVAEAQTAGRGRQGRSWVARPGDALLFSVLARVRCPAARLPTLAIAAGVAVRDAIASAAGGLAPGIEIGLKWPNDIVIASDRRKLAGILVETTMSGSNVDAVVVGIGINVHTRDFPEDLADRAASIAEITAHSPDRAELLAAALAALDRDLALVAGRGLAPLAARIAGADVLRGHVVRADADEGVAEGIDDDGRLVVKRADGSLARWSAGEVHLAR